MSSTIVRDVFTGAKIPKTLFKYRDFRSEWSLNNLKDGSIYFPAPIEFNDPFDCNIPVRYSNLRRNEELAKPYFERAFIDVEKYFNIVFTNDEKDIIRTNITADESNLIHHEKNTLERQRRDWGIYCMSSMSDNILQWSHYGGDHKGFCLGFDTLKLLHPQELFNAIGKVEYVKEYPIIEPSLDDLMTARAQFYFKAKEWKYESEYRVIKKGANQAFRFSADSLISIYLGCNISDDNKLELLTIRDNLYPSASVFKYELEDTKFGLKPVQLR